MLNKIPEATLRLILERTDLVKIVTPYTKLRRSGVSHFGICPFHKEQTPSFKAGKNNLYICFGCGAAGNAIQFLQRVEGISFMEAVRILADRSGVSLETGRVDRYAEMLRAEAVWFWDNAIDLGFGSEWRRCTEDSAWARRYVELRAQYPGIVRRYHEAQQLERDIDVVYRRALASLGALSDAKFVGLLSAVAQSVSTR